MTSLPSKLRFDQRVARNLREAFAIPITVVAIFSAIIVYGASILPGRWSGGRALNVTLGLIAIVWALGFVTRMFEPQSKLAGLIEAGCLFVTISFTGALATSVLAIGGGPFIDEHLIAMDAALFPFYDWKSVVLALPDHPNAYRLLSHVYASLNWQPIVLLAIVFFFAKLKDFDQFLGAWALGMAGCILPFHFLPAQSPYIYYGIAREDMAGALVGLPWDFLPKFEGIRSGAIDSIGIDNLTGMVTIPSFHACAAVILAWYFWRFVWLRWPFLLLNVGMALAAVPIGSHYVIDIVAGAAVAVAAISTVAFFDKRRNSANEVAPVPVTADLPPNAIPQ